MLVLTIIAIYMIAMLGIGLYFKKKVETPEDYYVAGRSLPWYLVIMTMSATYIGAGSTMADTGLAYDQGMSSFLSNVIAMAGMLMFGLLSPKVSKIGFKYRILSVSGLISFRFGKVAGVISACIVAWALIGTLAGQIIGSGTLIPIIFDNVGISVSYELAIVIMVAVMLTYTFLAGMFGVAWTDFVQCLILIVGMAILLPIMLIKTAGGWSQVTVSVPEGFMSLKPGMYVIGLMFTYLLYFLSGPPYWQRAFASASPKTSQVGTIGAVAIITFYSFMIAVIGISSKAIMPELPAEQTSQSVAIYLMVKLFHPAVAAIVAVAILAAIMSTMSGYLLTSVQAIITDIIKPFRQNLTAEKEVVLAKTLVAVVGIMSLIFAMVVRQILGALLLAMGFYAATMAASVIGAVFWDKATKAGCFASMFGGFGTYFIWKFALQSPWEMNAAIPGGIMSILLLIVVSLATVKTYPAPYFEGVGKNDEVVDNTVRA